MPHFLKPAALGVAVLAILVLGGVLLARGPTVSNTGGPPPPPSSPPSDAATPSATPALTDTSNWTPFTSERYGYTIQYPPTWVAKPATGDWDFMTSRLDFRTADADSFLSDLARVTAFADDVRLGTTEEQWIAMYYEGTEVNGAQCADLVDPQSITVDGRPAWLVVNDRCADAQAFVFIGSGQASVRTRVHVFAIWRADQQALLEAFLSTVEFQP